METSNINISEIITETINTLFENLFSSIDNNIYPILDNIVFINSNIMNDSYFEKILGNSTSNGILLIANSLLIGFVLYYCIRLFFSNYLYSKVERPYEFLFKIIISCIFMNSSFFICEKIIFLNSSISLAIRSIGEDLFNKSICFSELINELNSIISINTSNFNLFSLDGIIKSLSSVGLFNLIFTYSLRYIMIKVFILISPFAILSVSINATYNFFRSWLRAFISLLLIQTLISFILLITFSLDFNSSIFSKFIYIGSIYALIKSNFYIKELIGGISIDINSNFVNFKSSLYRR